MQRSLKMRISRLFIASMFILSLVPQTLFALTGTVASFEAESSAQSGLTTTENDVDASGGQHVSFAEAGSWALEWQSAGLTGGWQNHYFEDGSLGTISDVTDGIELTAGPSNGVDVLDNHHAVWIDQEFSGDDVRLEYDVTRLDTDAGYGTTQLHFLATTSQNAIPFCSSVASSPEDIKSWNRPQPQDEWYTLCMDAVHLSYSNPQDEIRMRQNSGRNLITPVLDAAGRFEQNKTYHVSVIKEGDDVTMTTTDPTGAYADLVQTWTLNANNIDAGRIGFRNMATRSTRLQNIEVFTKSTGSGGSGGGGGSTSTPTYTEPTVTPPTLPAACKTDNIISLSSGASALNITSTLQNLSPGDTVELAPGQYKITNGAVFTNSGTQTDPICVVARDLPARQDAPGLQAGNVTIKSGGSIKFNDTQWWRIEGLDFRSRSIQMVGSNPYTPFHFDFVNNYHSSPTGGGDTIILKDGTHVSIRDTIFSYVRSNKVHKDRTAFIILNESGYISYTDNLCENVSADCIQAQGNQPMSAGQVHNVLVAGNEMRINRPHPFPTGGDPFCNTGENGIDIKIGKDWIIRDNTFSGYQVIPGCVDFESTSAAGEAIVLHKNSALNFLIKDNLFLNNSKHIYVYGKTCTSQGRNCGGPQATENVIIRGNTFDSTNLGSGIRYESIKIQPGVGSNSRALGPLQFTVSKDVLIEDNTFIGNTENIGLYEQTEFLYGATQVEVFTINSVTTTFDPPPGGVTRPIGTTIQNNTFTDGIVQVSPGVECFGNQCTPPIPPLNCSTAVISGQGSHTHSALPADSYVVWNRVRTTGDVAIGVQVHDETTAEVYCQQVDLPDSAGQWTWVAAPTPLAWAGVDADVNILGLGSPFDLDCVFLATDVSFTPTTKDDCTATADVTPPSLTITSPLESSTVFDTQVTVTATADDVESGVDSIEFIPNGNTGAAVSVTALPFEATFTFTEGQNQVEVIATDGVGLTTSQTVTFTVYILDTTPPSLAITSPAEATILTTADATIQADALDAESSVTQVSFVLDGDTLNPSVDTQAPFEATFNGLLNGAHSVEATATNGDGLTTVQTVNFTVDVPDVTAPLLSITAPTEAETVLTETVTAVADTSDPESGITSVEFILDGNTAGSVILTSAPYDIPYTLADGAHSVEVIATNGEGLITTQTVNFTVDVPDTTAPNLVITAPSESQILSITDATVTTTADDPESGITSVEFILDGNTAGSVSTTSLPYDTTFTALAEGAHSVEVIATNGEGLTTTQTVTFTVDLPDTTAPLATILSPAAAEIVLVDTVAVAVDASDPESGIASVAVTIDGQTITDTVAPYDPVFILANGSYTADVAVTNGDGLITNTSVTFTVNAPDATAPNLSITAPTEAEVLAVDQVTVTATADDPETGISQLEFILDNDTLGSIVTTNAPHQALFSGLTEGAHSVEVIATNGEGLTTTQTVTFTVDLPDLTAPLATILSPTQSEIILVDTTTVSVDASDLESGIGSVEFILDGNTAGSMILTSAPYDMPYTLANGVHTVDVIVLNGDGLATNTSVTFTIDAPDATAPNLSINTPSEAEVVTVADILATAMADDPETGITSVTFVLDGDTLNPFTVLSTPYEAPFTGLADGAHSIEVTATNGEGLTTTQTVTFTVDLPDLTAPLATITAPTEAEVILVDTATVAVDASDAESGIQDVSITVDGQTIVDATAPYDANFVLANGTYSASVVVTNGDGLTTNVSVSFTIDAPDATAPNLTINTPSEAAVLTVDQATVAVTADDPESGVTSVEFVLDGDTLNPITVLGAPFETTFNTLAEGAHSVDVTATNGEGLTTTQTVTFTVDLPDVTPPVVSITSPSEAQILPTALNTITVDATDTESGITQVDITVDGVTTTDTTLPYEASATLANGNYTAQVTATNGEGLTTTTSVSFTVDIPDVTPPVVAITAPTEAEVLLVDQATVSATVTDPESTITDVSTTVDGTTISTATAPYDALFTGLADGSYTATVVATNDEGLQTTQVVNFSVDVPDVTAPTVNITAPVEAEVLLIDQATVTADASDPESGVTQVDITVDGQTVTSTNAPYTATFNGLADGSYSGVVTATNGDGLTTTETVNFTVDVPDTTAPNLTITAPTEIATLVIADATITADSDDPESGITGLSFVLNGDTLNPVTDLTAPYATTFNGLADGPHTVEVTATNGEGLTTTATVNFTVDVPDTTAPVVAITAPTEAQTLTVDQVTVDATASDPESGVTQVDITVDGQTISDTTAPYNATFAGLADGTYSAIVTATNGDGLTTTETVNFTVDVPDTTAPIVNILTPTPSQLFTVADVTVDAGVSDPESGISNVEFILDSNTAGSVILTGAPYDMPYTALANGLHTVEVIATNGEGLSTTASITFEVDVPTVELLNLAPNPDFETDPYADYFTFGSIYGNFSWDDQTALSNAHSLKIVAHTLPPAVKKSPRWISRTVRIPVTPGEEYTAKVYAKTENVVGNVEIGLAFWNTSRSFNSVSWATTTQVNGTSDWTEIEITGIAPAGVEYARVEMRVNGTGTAWFDDASVTDGTTLAN